jgi:hypothetical protein
VLGVLEDVVVEPLDVMELDVVLVEDVVEVVVELLVFQRERAA